MTTNQELIVSKEAADELHAIIKKQGYALKPIRIFLQTSG